MNISSINLPMFFVLEDLCLPYLTPYISFKDNAREAMQFYQSVFGGKLDMSTFEEYHAAEDPAEGNKIMHAQLETPNGMTLMGADTPNSMPYENGSRISVTLSGADAFRTARLLR